MRVAAWLQHGGKKTQQLIDKKKHTETEEIKKNLPNNRGFRQVNKLGPEDHERIKVVWNVMGWNVILLPSEPIAVLMTRNFSSEENKACERHDYLIG